MIHKLTYSVTFPTNGISLSGELSPEPGITAVTGPNGSGKTFAASEMVRYMLFGKDALRGPASDYKKLNGTMLVTIGDTKLEIERGKNESVKTTTGEVVAVGAKAVNQYLREALGMSLDMFDVICACNQKESERFTRLKPAERKRMIDEIVGLSQNEAVEKMCRDEAKMLRRDADTLRQNIVPALEPVKPDNYKSSKELADIISAAKANEKKRVELERTIALVGPEPVAPEEMGLSRSVADLEAHEAERQRIIAHHGSLTRSIAQIPDALYTAEQLDNEQAWLDYNDEFERRGAPPCLAESEIGEERHKHAVYDAWVKAKGIDVSCPHCHASFNTAGEEPEKPSYKVSFLNEQADAHRLWATPLVEPKVDRIPLTKADLNKARLALARQEEKRALQAELEAIRIPVDLSGDLKAARQIEAEWAWYKKQYNAWRDRLAAADAAVKELKKLKAPIDIEAAEASYVAAKIYEAQVQSYTVAKAEEERLTKLVVQKSEKAEAFKAGADALQRARAVFKAHLAPSLGRIGSALISQMTGGVLNTIYVDEEMNISVDGQDVATLSGAGATVANLALRLALGQVLVAKIFPVFIADEADADADADRAQFIVEAFKNLKERLKQIIIITHKSDIEFDNVVTLNAS